MRIGLWGGLFSAAAGCSSPVSCELAVHNATDRRVTSVLIRMSNPERRYMIPSVEAGSIVVVQGLPQITSDRAVVTWHDGRRRHEASVIISPVLRQGLGMGHRRLVFTIDRSGQIASHAEPID